MSTRHKKAFVFVNHRDDRFAALSHVQSQRREREKGQPVHSPVGGNSPATAPSVLLLRPRDDSLDPFYCTSIGTATRVPYSLLETLIDVYTTTTMAESFGSRQAIQGWRMIKWPQEPIIRRLTDSVSDPMLMYSSLAMASLYVGWMRGMRARPPVEYYIGKTLETVKDRISGCQDWDSQRRLVMAIHVLAETQLWTGIRELWSWCPDHAPPSDPHSLAACRMHLQAIKVLVATSPRGWSAEAACLFKGCVLTDKFLALYTSTAAVLPLTWDPSPSTTDVHVSSFLLHRRLDDDLVDLIRGVLHYVAEAQARWRKPDNMHADADVPWLFLRLQSLSFRLIALKTMGLSEVVRQTMIIILLEGTEYRGAQVSAQLATEAQLEAIVSLTFAEMDDLIFWCACNGAMACVPGSRRDAFVTVIIEAVTNLGIEVTFDSFRAVLGRFLYLGEKQDAMLEQVVSLAQSRHE